MAEDDEIEGRGDDKRNRLQYSRNIPRLSSPSRRKLPLRNNFVSSNSGPKAATLSSSASLLSPSRHLPKKNLAKSTPLSYEGQDRSRSPLRGRSNEHSVSQGGAAANVCRTGTSGYTTSLSSSSLSSPLPFSNTMTAKSRYDILPILTSSGESVFEVGLEGTAVQSSISPSSSQEHRLPVFRLPTVTSLEFVNRIPRDDSVYEKAQKQREKAEFEHMKKHLGLSTQEIRELEQVLGKCGPRWRRSGTCCRLTFRFALLCMNRAS